MSALLFLCAFVWGLQSAYVESAVGVFVVGYDNDGNWNAALINGSNTSPTNLCGGYGLGLDSSVVFANIFPVEYEAGFYDFIIVTANNTKQPQLRSQSMTSSPSESWAPFSFYSMSIGDLDGPLCYTPEWECDPSLLTSPVTVVGMAQLPGNNTIVTYDPNTQMVQFTLMMEANGCFTEQLYEAGNIVTSSPLVDFWVGQPGGGSGVISIVDSASLSALFFTDQGVLFQAIDLKGMGYSAIYAAKFNGDSEAVLTILGTTTAGVGQVAEVPLSLNWGTSAAAQIPDLSQGQYQAALYDYLGFVVAPDGSSSVNIIGFDGTVTMDVGTSQFFLLSATQQLVDYLALFKQKHFLN